MDTLVRWQKNDPCWKKFIFMTILVLALLGILGVTGFYLWFLFPIQRIHGLTYMETPHLVLYYTILNLLDVVGIIFFSRWLYFRWVESSNPVRDGIILGLYMVILSWLVDIVVYVFIRNTLPTIQEYFLGKNQPEIGIAWAVAFATAVLAGWLEQQRRTLSTPEFRRKLWVSSSSLFAAAVTITWLGVAFFDIRP